MSFKTTLKTFKKNKNITHLVVASVGDVEKSLFSFNNEIIVHFVSHNDPFPFVNEYETPQTLGIDRMVLAAGATLQFLIKTDWSLMPALA
jgi:type III pantothenate kinase